MDSDFRIIRQISKDPPTFVQDNLQWELLPLMESGLPFRVERNDNLDPTPEDYARVQESILFMIAPQYGPQQ